ncbi:MAG: hypothetical protein ACJAVR_002307 [Paracoccaceae bacterium]
MFNPRKLALAAHPRPLIRVATNGGLGAKAARRINIIKRPITTCDFEFLARHVLFV